MEWGAGHKYGGAGPEPSATFETPPPTAEKERASLEEIYVTGSRVRSGEESTLELRAAHIPPPVIREHVEQPVEPRFAQAPGDMEGKAKDLASPSTQPPVASDAHSGPLVIYAAHLWLAVFQVADKQREVIEVARALGGRLSSQTSTRVVVRVPAARFDDALTRVEACGELVERHVTAQEVTDQFRDLSLRLHNAEKVRDRLAALLNDAETVEQSLAIERELDRITERIELLKGQLKALSDRIAFSTITVEFGVKTSGDLDSEVSLPFSWLKTLGLATLMDLE